MYWRFKFPFGVVLVVISGSVIRNIREGEIERGRRRRRRGRGRGGETYIEKGRDKLKQGQSETGTERDRET